MSHSLPPSPEEQQYEESLNPVTEYEWSDDAIKLIFASYVPNHPAYGMTFSEYRKHRLASYSEEESETVRIHFRMPNLLTAVSSDLAIRNGVSSYSFMMQVIEQGVIHFMRDYHDQCDAVKNGKAGMIDKLEDEESERKYVQIVKQTIALEARERGSRCLTPSVKKWVGNYIKEIAIDLNMTASDFAFLSWCIGTKVAVPNLPERVKFHIENKISLFNSELDAYIKRINELDGCMSS